jgi:CBS domain protein
VESANKHIILTNDKVKNGRVTKLKVLIQEIEAEEETE